MPRKRKLPAGVTGLAEFKEARRLAAIRRAARAFMALPEEERRRQLMAMLDLRVQLVTEEKRPAEASQGPAVEPE